MYGKGGGGELEVREIDILISNYLGGGLLSSPLLPPQIRDQV